VDNKRQDFLDGVRTMTVGEMLLRNANRFADKMAVICEGVALG
jgi:hypothetical protein